MIVWFLLSKPIFWNPETHFRGRIFELEKWVFESTRFDFSSIDSFYDIAWQLCPGNYWKYVFCGVSIHLSGSCVWFLILRSARGRRNGEHKRGLASYLSYIKNHLCISNIVLILLMIKYAINLMLIVRNRFCHTWERFSWTGLPFHKNESLSTIVLCTEISTHIRMQYDHSDI